MFEIVQLGQKTFYIPNATNIGIYLENENDVFLIDTGIDSDTGKKILKLVAEKGWTVKGIICTHSHADHIGGNKVIVDRTSCKVLANGAERSIAESTFLNNTAVYGGYPYEAITNKFFYSEPSGSVLELSDNLPEGLQMFKLPGHTFDMIGIKTPDDVYFLADALVSSVTITKYHVYFLYDIAKHLETLSFLSDLSSANKKSGVPATYVASHCEKTDDIEGLITMNLESLVQIKNLVLSIIKVPTSLEIIVKTIFSHYELRINAAQHTLITSTMRSYLSYLINSGLAEIVFENNLLKFKAV